MARSAINGKMLPDSRRIRLPCGDHRGMPHATLFLYGTHHMSTALTDQIHGLIAPFNKKGVELTDATTFAGDLEWDSLTVMDFVAEVEDTFDIIISMNMQAEIETVGQLVAAVEKLQG
jgi:acyl carrier protein